MRYKTRRIAIEESVPVRFEPAQGPPPWVRLTIKPSELGLPGTRKDRFSDVPCVHITHRDHFLHVSCLYTPLHLRGLGLAAHLMKAAVEQCDKSQRVMWLDALPFHDSPVEQVKLFAFYQRFGFERAVNHPYSMRRVPRSSLVIDPRRYDVLKGAGAASLCGDVSRERLLYELRVSHGALERLIRGKHVTQAQVGKARRLARRYWGDTRPSESNENDKPIRTR
jgi:GNAT superfamily N-acetyltransferase